MLELGASSVRGCQHWHPCCTHTKSCSVQPDGAMDEEKAEEKQTYVSVHVLQVPVHPVSVRSLPHAESLLDAAEEQTVADGALSSSRSCCDQTSPPPTNVPPASLSCDR